MTKTKTKTRPTVRIVKPRKDENGEWRVGVIVNGVDREERAYYTDDADDARQTYHAMVHEEVMRGRP